MAEEYKEQIKKMLENIDDEDIVFLRQIYIMFKVHLQKGLITGYKEGNRKKIL